MDELFSKHLDIELTAKGGDLHTTLLKALNIARAYGHSLYLKFPQGYSVRIWADSTLNDIKRVEELEHQLWVIKNTEKVQE